MEPTEIQKFYENKTVFLTGGTGFLGKTLIEKLLRSCSELNKIIVPIRSKKNQSFESRKLEFFNDKLFDKIKIEKLEVLQKVLFVNSNLESNKCGLDDADYNYILNTVNIIFHSAATVDFNGPLSDAVKCNIKATKNLIHIATEMKHLQAFIHVSTLWSHGIMDYIEEKVLKFNYCPEVIINLVDNIDENTLRKLTPSILDVWPNTYTFTKQIAETLILRAKELEDLPVAIFRAPAISALYQEPLPGWVNGIQAISAYGIGLALGLIKVLYTDPEENCHFIPGDFVVNCLIAMAWDMVIHEKNEELKVYNYSSTPNPLLRKYYYNSSVNTKYPLENTVWTPGYMATNSKWLFDKYSLLYHNIPAYIWDTFLKIFNQKPRYQKLIKRNQTLLNDSAWFLLSEFKFEYKNTPALWNLLNEDDKKLFNFDVTTINWDEYLDSYNKSLKMLLKEDFGNINQCEAKRYLLKSKY